MADFNKKSRVTHFKATRLCVCHYTENFNRYTDCPSALPEGQQKSIKSCPPPAVALVDATGVGLEDRSGVNPV